MKKYVKPELFYERFELSQHIADCAWELTYESPDTCAANSDTVQLGAQEPLFTDALEACKLKSSVWQDYCYQTGANSDFKVHVS